MSLSSGCKILKIPTKEKPFVKYNDRNSTVGIVTRLRAGRSRVLIPVVSRDFSLLQTSGPTLGPKYPPIQTVQELLPGAKRSCVRLNSSLAHRLRSRGAIHVIRLYAIMVRRRKTLPVPLYYTHCPQNFTQHN